MNALKLEPYVKGVVPLEVPSRWPAAALETQAVAARTYAIARLAAVEKARDVRRLRRHAQPGLRRHRRGGDVRLGGRRERTAGRVLVYRGKIITAYYSSSSGGRTASAAEAMGTPIPYLVSVPDPYDTISPNHDWGPVLFDARKIAKALKVSGGLLDLRATPGPFGPRDERDGGRPGRRGDRDRADAAHAARAALDVVHARLALARPAARRGLRRGDAADRRRARRRRGHARGEARRRRLGDRGSGQAGYPRDLLGDDPPEATRSTGSRRATFARRSCGSRSSRSSTPR